MTKAFNSKSPLPRMLSALPQAKLEQMRPHDMDALEEKPFETGSEGDEAEPIPSSFTVPDSLEGLTP